MNRTKDSTDTRADGVRLELPNRQRKLPAGMRSKAKFPNIGDEVLRPASSTKTGPRRLPAAAPK